MCQVVVETGVTGRGRVTLSSELIGVKPLIHRDWERALLVRQPQATQFCLAVKRLNCTFAFSASQLSGITGGGWCPEMRWRVFITQSDGYDSNHQAMCKKISAWLGVFIWKTASFCSLYLIFSLYLSVHPPFCSADSFSPSVYMHALRVLCRACCLPLGVFFVSTFLAQVVYLKFCPGATLDPCLHCRST